MRVSFITPTNEVKEFQPDFEKSAKRSANARSGTFDDQLQTESHSNRSTEPADADQPGLDYGTGQTGRANPIPSRDYRSMLDEQQRSFEELQAMNRTQHASQMRQSQEMMANGQRSANDLLMLQSRLAASSQQFTTISNILKSRHDTRSHAIQNLK